MKDEITAIIKKTKYSFFPFIHPSNTNFYELVKNSTEKMKNIFWLNPLGFNLSKKAPNLSLAHSVVNASIQIAYWMGYRKICFLGVDASYSGQAVKKITTRDLTAENNDDPNHFDPRYFGKGRSYHNPDVESMISSFKKNKKFFENEIRFFNCTYGGKLEVFERSSIQNILNLTDKDIGKRFIDYISRDISLNDLEKFHKSNKIYMDLSANESLQKISKLTEINKLISTYVVVGPYKNIYYLKRRR